MPEVDPATLSRFALATASVAAVRDAARVTDLHIAINPSDRAGVYRRLRRSQTHIGATFRGLEPSIGSEPALEVVAMLMIRQSAEARHGAA